MKYSEIKNIESLDAARRRLKADIDAKRRELASGAEAFRDACTPMAIVAEGLRRASATIPVDRIVLSLIRRLRRR